MSNSLNLSEVNQEQALNLAKFFLGSHQNLFLFGKKGCGKTAIAMQAANECRFKVNYLNLSVLERPDLMGYPQLDSAGETVSFKSPYYLPKLPTNAQPDTIILFDEIDKCAPETTAPLLEILQFRTINGQPLNVAGCILTGNLLNEGAYANLISTALLDRAAKFVLQFDFDQWIEWAKNYGVHDLILGFLRNFPELVCAKNDDTSYASPSPRGWTLASDALIRAKEMRMADIESVFQIVSGFVGNEAGLRFKMWYEHFRKFEPYVHSLIEKGSITGLNFAGLIPTEQMVFIIAACHYARLKIVGETKTKARFTYLERLVQFLQREKVAKEMQVIGLHNSFSFDQITRLKLYQCSIFFNHFNELSVGVQIKR